ncbi:lantibiotic modifying enzyme [Saccharothrix ecbatanensis]|uniref:Lantibiotic modifying enzyme n=1 Tax=Saccharothrix ecbatanensis TaxID=1105145 RepID=A0A7W9HHL6_9PSEU|nr:lanthionine synthetase LanC family protein [Saccharothrix ecbatanensis]MBB5801999.1 lantibiotic modifying enzyme [Saccharothrix ecbatanensis]
MTAMETATRLAERICDEARWHGESCDWLDATGRALDVDLYEGSAGIAWFLAQHAALTGSERSAQTAAAAARSVPGKVAARPTPRRGLFEGDLGALWAVGEVGTLIGDAELVDRARALIPDVRRRLDRADPGIDLVGGGAGDVLAMIGLTGSAVAEADLINAETAVHHVGMAHGLSGLACALLEVHSVTGTPAYRSRAMEAFSAERAWFDPEACAWGRTASTSWCNGSAGIGLARLRAVELAPEPHLRAEAGAALASVHASVAASLSGRRTTTWEQANFSVCHGLMGAADLLVQAAVVLGVPEHLRAAERVVDHGVATANAHGRWACGTTTGAETVGLFLGLAGIGAVCLRVAHPGRVPPVGLPVRAYSMSE